MLGLIICPGEFPELGFGLNRLVKEVAEVVGLLLLQCLDGMNLNLVFLRGACPSQRLAGSGSHCGASPVASFFGQTSEG